jgi:hypothetical protein
LSLKTVERFADEICTLVNWQRNSDAWCRHCGSAHRSQRPGQMRSAQTSAKYGAMVSFPGSTE